MYFATIIFLNVRHKVIITIKKQNKKQVKGEGEPLALIEEELREGKEENRSSVASLKGSRRNGQWPQICQN